nr:TM0106 family RecB-like putative nuclease [Amylibacter sp.]
MKKINDTIQLSATDLVGHLNCGHLTALDVQVATGALKKPENYDPLLEILRERGQRHEDAYIQHLRDAGHQLTKIEGIDITDSTVDATLEAMRNGSEIIIQAALRHGRWSGRADVLRRVETPSDLGNFSYEIIDTKLARETKGGTVLQLCLYADLLDNAQGRPPEKVFVVAPWSDYQPQEFRFADYAAYFRRVKAAAENALELPDDQVEYPDPKSHCDVCRWEQQCEKRRRADDHLCLVAGISKNQISELQANGFGTAKTLADMPSPMPFQPQRGAPASFERVRAQAAIQVSAREAGERKFEFLDVVPEFGFAALPEPSAGDVFFDIESDQFVGEQGLEYLFGYSYFDDAGAEQYEQDWAFDRASEKACFERFVDFVTARRVDHPDMHIYHFGGYEAGALKRLMGRYATREDEVDNLLRGKVLVDLLTVTKHAIRASVESYSLKKLEPFCGYERKVSLRDANMALTKVTAGLELDDIPSIDADTKAIVSAYNADDCFATKSLRDWLEDLRASRVADGNAIPRPEPGQDGPSEDLSEQQQRVLDLIEQLTNDIPVDPEERSPEQQARWILAYILDWHRRESKADYWELFRLKALNEEELLEEKAGISRLTFIDTIELSPRGIPVHRYQFSLQDIEIKGSEYIYEINGEKIGTIASISIDDRTIDIKKMGKTKDLHPSAIFAHRMFGAKEQAASLFRLGEYVAKHGIEGDGPYKSARELLLRAPMDIGGEPFQADGEGTLDAALRVAWKMNGGVLPIQGPPGTGKSFTGARMICELVRQGKKVGITANSHKVIRNLIDKVIEAAPEMGVDITCVQKPETGNNEPDQSNLFFVRKNNAEVFSALASNRAQVAGATQFCWAPEDAFETLDVLVVDEAGQMSLANVLAVSQAAQTVIMLGDPQQLEQPTQGTHPDGTGVSALDHLLGGRQTIEPSQGLFLGTTYRLHPDICAFNSELFYESKLHAVEGCEQQLVQTESAASGAGLRFLPVAHSGNTSSSIEEADMVKSLVEDILDQGAAWTDRDGVTKPITLEDILIIAPYNAQVIEIQKRLPTARVGTVDKFQGQEAPIAIYSMATSSHADAPRGMEFLYSGNRFNVAISRAQCLAILVASPQVFEADCQTPRQMQLINAFCRYLEMSTEVAT